MTKEVIHRKPLQEDLKVGRDIIRRREVWESYQKRPQPFIYELCRQLVASNNRWIEGVKIAEALQIIAPRDSRVFNPDGHFGQAWTYRRGPVARWMAVLERDPPTKDVRSHTRYRYRLKETHYRAVKRLFRSLGRPVVPRMPSEFIERDLERPRSLKELREIAIVAASASRSATSYMADRQYRSEVIKKYARERAKGKCEACGQVAPFVGKDEQPFLEVHHIQSLSKDSGPDHPRNVAAICPNCHRHIHHGKDGLGLNQTLQEEIKEKEASLG